MNLLVPNCAMCQLGRVLIVTGATAAFSPAGKRLQNAVIAGGIYTAINFAVLAYQRATAPALTP